MGTFMKDSAILLKQNAVFAKQHWKGMLAVNAAIVAGECVWLMKEPIKKAVKEKLLNKNKTEVLIDDEVLEGEVGEP